MKSIYFLCALVIVSLLAGWYLPDAAVDKLAGSCEVKSLVIYDETEQTIFNHARISSETGRDNHKYSALLVRQRNGYADDTVTVERMFRTESTFGVRNLTIVTVNAQRISGPNPSDQWPGAYLDPIAEKDFYSSIWLFRVGGTLLTGFEGKPRAICHPAR